MVRAPTITNSIVASAPSRIEFFNSLSHKRTFQEPAGCPFGCPLHRGAGDMARRTGALPHRRLHRRAAVPAAGALAGPQGPKTGCGRPVMTERRARPPPTRRSTDVPVICRKRGPSTRRRRPAPGPSSGTPPIDLTQFAGPARFGHPVHPPVTCPLNPVQILRESFGSGA